MTLTRRQPVRDAAGPFKGMQAKVSGEIEPGFADWIHNGYPMDPYAGGEIVPRPGRQGIPTSGNTVRPGMVHPVQIQLFERFNQNGVDRMVCIEGGKFYSTVSGGWAESVNAATFAGAGITISSLVQRYYACNYRGKLVVVGPSVAFTWDGTVNGGLVKLTAAGTSFFGRPWVYAAKLWFITGDQKTVIWSEENDETSGYAGIQNAWDLNQTSTGKIVAGVGTNEALYYFRQDSVGAIYGGSSAEFQTTSTNDAVSATEGSDAPEGSIEAGDALWFVDGQGRPACIVKGSRGIIPLWRDFERGFTPYTDDGAGYSYLAFAPNQEKASLTDWATNNRVVHLRSLDLVFFAYRLFFSGSSSLAFDVLLGYHVQTRRLQCVWQFPTAITGLIEVKDISFGTGEHQLVILDDYGHTYAVNASALMARNLDDTFGLDTSSHDLTTTDVSCTVIGPRHFLANDVELRVTRLDVEYLGRNDNALMTVLHATPEVLAQGGVDLVDQATGDLDPRTLGVRESVFMEGVGTVGAGFPPTASRATIGYDELCRWITFGFTWKHQASGGARLRRWKVQAIPDSDQPDAY